MNANVSKKFKYELKNSLYKIIYKDNSVIIKHAEYNYYLIFLKTQNYWNIKNV